MIFLLSVGLTTLVLVESGNPPNGKDMCLDFYDNYEFGSGIPSDLIGFTKLVAIKKMCNHAKGVEITVNTQVWNAGNKVNVAHTRHHYIKGKILDPTQLDYVEYTLVDIDHTTHYTVTDTETDWGFHDLSQDIWSEAQIIKVTLDVDDEMTLEAEPVSGFEFDHWVSSEWSSCDGSTNPTCHYDFSEDISIQAFFIKVYNVEMKFVDQDGNSISPGCGIEVTKIPPSFSRKYSQSTETLYEDDEGKLPESSLVTLKTPDPSQECNGYRFDHLVINGQVVNPVGGVTSVTIDGDTEIKFVFWKKVKVRVSVHDQDGNGLSRYYYGVYLSVEPPSDAENPPPSEPPTYYANGDEVVVDAGSKVTAQRSAGGNDYNFDHWGSSCQNGGSSDTCTFTVGSDGGTVEAIWWELVRDLTVDPHLMPSNERMNCRVYIDFTPPSGSRKAPEPDGYYGYREGYYGEGRKHIENLYKGTTLTVTADECNGHRFDHINWDGSDTRSTSFTLTRRSHTLKPIYWEKATLYIKMYNNAGTSGNGYVDMTFTPPDGDLNPDVPSDGTYRDLNTLKMDAGTSITADPLPPDDYVFDHWVSPCTGTGEECSFVLNDETTLKGIYWRLVDLQVYVRDDHGEKAASCDVNLDFTPPSGAQREPPEPDGLYGEKLFEDLYQETELFPTSKQCEGYKFDHWESHTTWGPTSKWVGQRTLKLILDGWLKAVYWKLTDLSVEVMDDLEQSVDCRVNLGFSAPEGAMNDPPEPSGDYSSGVIEDLYRGTEVEPEPLPCQGYKFDHWELDSSDWSGSSFGMGSSRELKAVYWKLTDLRVKVVDELGQPIDCKVNLGFSAPEGAMNDPPEPSGDYSSGVIEDLYRGTEVEPEPLPCQGYRFDHWELDSSDWSGSSFGMGSSRELKAVYWKQYTLTVEAYPDGSGNAHPPWSRGTYVLDRGTVVTLLPVANDGWTFDHWELDGREENGSRLRIRMDGNHRVVMHFKGALTFPQSLIVAGAGGSGSGSGTGGACAVEMPSVCEITGESLGEMKYRGMYTDLEFNRDLLSRFAGRASPGEEGNYVVLGGPNAVPYPWQRYGVEFSGDELTVANRTYRARFGVRGYGTILIDCERNVIRVAGVTRYGTRAALMWLLNHPDEVSGKLLVVVEWVDRNRDGMVQDWEVGLLYARP